MFRRLTLLAVTIGMTCALVAEPIEPLPRNESNVSIRHEVQLAIDKGVEHLAKTQREDGTWGKLGVTGFAVMALQRNPRGTSGGAALAAAKGLAAIRAGLEAPQSDDPGWNVPPALLALPKLDPVRKRALTSLTRKFPSGMSPESIALFLRAANLGEPSLLRAPEPPAGGATAAWIFNKIGEGFAPGEAQVGAAVRQLGTIYTLESNPGGDGLHQYYFFLSAALLALDHPDLVLPNGRKVDVARALSEKLINGQKADGSWKGASDHWMEKDPDLVTSYSLLALEAVYRLL